MAKTIYQYAGFTATDLKNRGSATCDMVVNGTGVDCTNITDTRVKNVLGESTTAVSGLCSSSLVNKWSNFSPRLWSINSFVMADAVKTPYSMGAFAGYCHTAVAPYVSSMPSGLYIIEGQTSLNLPISVLLGQVDWMSTPFLKSLNLEILVGGSSLAVMHENMNPSTYLTNTHTFDPSINTTGWTTPHIATFRYYFGKDSANSYTELCNVPNLSGITATINVWMKAKLGTFVASSGLASTLGKPSAVLIKDTADLLNCYVSQNDAGVDTITLSCHGIDTNSDGVGDLTILTKDRYTWYRLNGGSWVIGDYLSMQINYSAGGTFYLPFSVTYNDVVDCEIR